MNEPIMAAGPQPVLRVIGPGCIAIVAPGPEPKATLELRGDGAARIARWYRHMETHGTAWAATYLAGVLDGLRAGHEDMARSLVADLQESRRELEREAAREAAHQAARRAEPSPGGA